jgi:hypothetical protein
MNDQYPNLKKAHGGKTLSEDKWTEGNLRDGFQYFFDLNGHYPTAYEIDSFEYLPSSRSIQRAFGGLVNIRKQLNLNAPKNYARGKTRKLLALEMDSRARSYEEEFYNYLISKIPEIRVHEHKVIRPGNVSSDFFIYTDDKNGIVLDLFYSSNLKNVSKIIQNKQFKYAPLPFQTYFIIVGNDAIRQEDVDNLIKNRKIPLSSNIQVFTEVTFKNDFDNIVNIEQK